MSTSDLPCKGKPLSEVVCFRFIYLRDLHDLVLIYRWLIDCVVSFIVPLSPFTVDISLHCEIQFFIITKCPVVSRGAKYGSLPSLRSVKFIRSTSRDWVAVNCK